MVKAFCCTPHLPEILHDRVVWMVAASVVDMAARICHIEALTTATDEHLHLLLIEHSHLRMGLLHPSGICLEHPELGAVPSFRRTKEQAGMTGSLLQPAFPPAQHLLTQSSSIRS